MNKPAQTFFVGLCAILFSLVIPIEVTHAAEATKTIKASTVKIAPGPKAAFDLQSALINAIPGDVIQMAAGVYHFESELNIVCDNITLQGAGPEKTILSFKKQIVGSNGITSTGDAFVIQDLAIEDTIGNAIKTLGAKDVTYRRVRVEWTGGPKSTNGAYGIYPVECQNVLIEDCTSIAASDAGIYVGQSQDVIVKGCVARQNVAGIEIENTLRADVFDNEATNNTGGLLVFDLPGLNITNGRNVRVYRNKIYANNHVNFAPKGTIVAEVPSGTGLMVMATDHVEVFDNDITDNQTNNIMVVSFLITERQINDKKYDPYPEAFSIHDNRMSGSGAKPGGQLGTLLAPVVGLPFPDIFFDGLVDSKKLVDGQLPKELRSSIRNNGKATFANVNIGNFSAANLLSGKYKVDRDLAAYDNDLASIESVTLKPHAKPVANGNPAVAIYRAAPPKLSGWGIFTDADSGFVPADDLVRYELNTPLFSDYTSKHRYIRLPKGGQIKWSGKESLEFPVGTVIAKTFAYPDAADDKTDDERFLETRIELRDASGWYGYSYIWNHEQTDADLRLGGGAVDVSWKDDAGTVHQNKYQIPNANQCLSCHSQNGKYEPLGPTARNLNRPTTLGDKEDQLTAWIGHGMLTDAPPAAERTRLPDFSNSESGSLNDRARAWLEVNCAHCHNPAGSARTSGLDLRTVQLNPAKFGIFKSPVAAGKGSGDRRYDIIPGKPDESILMYRLETNEAGSRMPNLARNLTHDEAIDLIREWIAAMPVQDKK